MRYLLTMLVFALSFVAVMLLAHTVVAEDAVSDAMNMTINMGNLSEPKKVAGVVKVLLGNDFFYFFTGIIDGNDFFYQDYYSTVICKEGDIFSTNAAESDSDRSCNAGNFLCDGSCVYSNPTKRLYSLSCRRKLSRERPSNVVWYH